MTAILRFDWSIMDADRFIAVTYQLNMIQLLTRIQVNINVKHFDEMKQNHPVKCTGNSVTRGVHTESIVINHVHFVTVFKSKVNEMI